MKKSLLLSHVLLSALCLFGCSAEKTQLEETVDKYCKEGYCASYEIENQTYVEAGTKTYWGEMTITAKESYKSLSGTIYIKAKDYHYPNELNSLLDELLPQIIKDEEFLNKNNLSSDDKFVIGFEVIVKENAISKVDKTVYHAVIDESGEFYY